MSKWYEDLGHVLIGLIPGWGVTREWFQLPPENDADPVVFVDGREYWAKARVLDVFRDMAGYAVGDAFRTSVLVGLLIWKCVA